MAASAAKNPISRLLMHVIIPDARAYDYGAIEIRPMNNKRGVPPLRAPRLK